MTKIPTKPHKKFHNIDQCSQKLRSLSQDAPNLCVAGQCRDGVLGVLDVRRQQRQDVERLLGERRQRIWRLPTLEIKPMKDLLDSQPENGRTRWIKVRTLSLAPRVA